MANPSDNDEAPDNRWATIRDLERVENRLTKRIEEASGKGTQYATLLIAFLAMLGTIFPHINIQP